MANKIFIMKECKRIACIAHDNRKQDLLEWAKYNLGTLSKHKLFGTGTTGSLLRDKLNLDVKIFRSGPLGGDQQIGAKIAENEIDCIIFFWDPMEPQPHDVDVKALLRISVVYNIPVACNRSSADFIISSHLMSQKYKKQLIDYSKRITTK